MVYIMTKTSRLPKSPKHLKSYIVKRDVLNLFVSFIILNVLLPALTKDATIRTDRISGVDTDHENLQ